MKLLLLLAASTLSAAGSNKRGFPFQESKYIDNGNWVHTTSQMQWAYNWESARNADFPNFLEYVPMLWGGDAGHTDPNARNQGSGHILAFNEPDGCIAGVQSCLTPKQAADLYRQYLMPWAGIMSLGAPAVSNGPNGFQWLADWFHECHDCRVDFVPFHWYDQAWNFAYFIKYIENAYYYAGGDSGGRKIWITEFRAESSTSTPYEDQRAFLNSAIPWLDSRNYVERYAWYWADPNHADGTVVNADGNPTDLGNYFAYRGSECCGQGHQGPNCC